MVWQIVHTFLSHTAECRSARFSPDDRWLLTRHVQSLYRLVLMHCSAFDGTAVVRGTGADACTGVAARHDDRIIQARWHRTACMFATSSADKTVRLWLAQDA